MTPNIIFFRITFKTTLIVEFAQSLWAISSRLTVLHSTGHCVKRSITMCVMWPCICW